ncbi:hypothetical protein GWI33_002252 [Rhynchophorus ferrugineus]|uniref:Uncharacterized protein n=1 Tax=Rhynchophorus ferrugineus TaxID=354439 RepID=A0A834HXP1_RHYFE|nr:hypothetical protein GWI33_002252 [Rhynchophorus ferrugineus]
MHASFVHNLRPHDSLFINYALQRRYRPAQPTKVFRPPATAASRAVNLPAARGGLDSAIAAGQNYCPRLSKTGRKN